MTEADPVTAFFDAFARADAEAMNACYAPDATFRDPIFGPLDGAGVRAMWTMLCRALPAGAVTYEVRERGADRAVVAWRATYDYSATKRRVVNDVVSTLELRGGAITRQTDVFDAWRWSAQALGPAGALLGWTPFFKRRLRATAAARLAAFRAKGGDEA